MTFKPSASADDAASDPKHPQSLRVLASNRTNWTQALLTHPISKIPRVHELYQDHLNNLKEAHKQLLQKCLYEAFYHNLPMLEIYHDLHKLITSVPEMTWQDPKYADKRIAETFSHLPPHGRKAVRAVIATFAVRLDRTLYEFFFKRVMMEVMEWQHELSQEKGGRGGRVVDRVGRLTFEQKMGRTRPSGLPLLTYLAIDRWGKHTLPGLLGFYAMLPEAVLDAFLPE
ncbi:hypothetical protein HK097_002901 [Rhizophlyctis rosea]|uniref:Uncharacterized protein n=1 Tax=Rhizophlyctis rosea TaxID=64517 RepID=A0AAD5S2W8_9FUNG|nr:hypothetical protein HK097_002901 [Rhizophlyctis rosea]